MLISGATRLDGAPVDLRVGELIDEVGPRLTPHPDETVLDAGGRTVIPGLHDHHVHLYSAAAALSSVRVGPHEVHDRAGMARALAGAPVGTDGWIRAVGYHEAVSGPLDRALLDELTPPVPVRVQHRSGVLWTLNSAGLARIGLADHPDGRLRSADRDWTESLQRRDIDLSLVSRGLAALGVTAVTDATPDLDVGDIVRLTEAHRHGALAQRVFCLAPGKRILHDDGLDLDELTGWIAARHDSGGPVAVHCVTAAQLVVTLAALRAAGGHPGDRIEHAAVVPDDALADLAAAGVTVVTQPNFVAERGDEYLADVARAEHHELWRLASLRRAGVPVALSTDMPFGTGDPWACMRAAVSRSTARGAVLGGAERVSPDDALAMFFGEPDRPATPRTLDPGQPGDLCLLDGPPQRVREGLDPGLVVTTVVAGAVVFDRSDN